MGSQLDGKSFWLAGRRESSPSSRSTYTITPQRLRATHSRALSCAGRSFASSPPAKSATSFATAAPSSSSSACQSSCTLCSSGSRLVLRRDQGEETRRRRRRGRVLAEVASDVSLPMAAAGGVPRSATRRPRPRVPTTTDRRHFPQAYLSSDPESGEADRHRGSTPPTNRCSRRGRWTPLSSSIPDLTEKLEDGERPTLRVLARDGEENSKLAVRRRRPACCGSGPTR